MKHVLHHRRRLRRMPIPAVTLMKSIPTADRTVACGSLVRVRLDAVARVRRGGSRPLGRHPPAAAQQARPESMTTRYTAPSAITVPATPMRAIR
jgi:hypothetical protein